MANWLTENRGRRMTADPGSFKLEERPVLSPPRIVPAPAGGSRVPARKLRIPQWSEPAPDGRRPPPASSAGPPEEPAPSPAKEFFDSLSDNEKSKFAGTWLDDPSLVSGLQQGQEFPPATRRRLAAAVQRGVEGLLPGLQHASKGSPAYEDFAGAVEDHLAMLGPTDLANLSEVAQKPGGLLGALTALVVVDPLVNTELSQLVRSLGKSGTRVGSPDILGRLGIEPASRGKAVNAIARTGPGKRR
jgi:hypothetical protein